MYIVHDVKYIKFELDILHITFKIVTFCTHFIDVWWASHPNQ